MAWSPPGTASTVGSGTPSAGSRTPTLPVTRTPDGLRLAVRLTPGASRNGIDGIVIGPNDRRMLQLRIVAPPVDGAANTALIAYLAEKLGLKRPAIRILSGHTSRLKLLHLDGDATALENAVAALLG